MDLVSGVNPKPVTLAVGQNYVLADFGYNWGGSIGDLVWWDDNRNGVRDGGEAAIPNAAVLLYFDHDNNGILDPVVGDYQIGFAMTNASGNYLFDNLPPGNYLVDVYEDSITTNGVRNIVPTTDDVYAREPGAEPGHHLGGLRLLRGRAGQGNVFWDEDHNGVFDGGEAGLTPVTVTLTGFDMFNNPVTATTTTDANGHFVFIVPEGNYTLTYNTDQTTAMGVSGCHDGHQLHLPRLSWRGLAPGRSTSAWTTRVRSATWYGTTWMATAWAAEPGPSTDPGEPGIGGVTVIALPGQGQQRHLLGRRQVLRRHDH